MTIKTFKRCELKYFVTPRQYEILCGELERRMALDEYCAGSGSYMIYNLYFDTAGDDIILNSLAKPIFKEKLRMRSYAIPASADDTVFLELKKKFNGVVAKRRATLRYGDALAFIENGALPTNGDYEDFQVLREITDFLRVYDAKPKVFISYERAAYFDLDDPELRVSFDWNITARREAGFETRLVDDDKILMEIKTDGSIPLWLCGMLSDMGIRRTSFSKYGTEFKRHIARQVENVCAVPAWTFSAAGR